MLYIIGIGMFCLTTMAIVAMCLGRGVNHNLDTDNFKHKLEIKDNKK